MHKFILQITTGWITQTKSLKDQRTAETLDLYISYPPTPPQSRKGVLTYHPVCRIITIMIIIATLSRYHCILQLLSFITRNLTIGISHSKEMIPCPSKKKSFGGRTCG